MPLLRNVIFEKEIRRTIADFTEKTCIGDTGAFYFDNI